MGAVAPKAAEPPRSSPRGPVINKVGIKFALPNGKVSNTIETLNFLQSKFNKLEITVRAEDGQLTAQEYKQKIEESLNQSGINFSEGD